MRARGYNKYTRSFYIFTSFSVVAFAATMIAAPVLKSSADEINVGVNVSSVISLSISSDSVAMTAPIGGGFTSGNASATVTTNSAFGYTLAIEDADDNTSLTSSTSSDTVTSNYLGPRTEDNLESNNWGFSVDGTKYYAIPKKNSPLILSKTTSPTDDNGNATTILFGANTSRYLTSGTYADRIVFSAYSNGADGNPEGVDPSSDDPEELSDDFPEPYEEGEGTNENRLVLAKSMQDPKLKSYCAATYTPTMNSASAAFTKYFSGDKTPKAIVKDKRDGNKYEIAKLADGRCWMTQNIAIINITITPELSDIENNYTLPQSNFNALAYTPITYNAAYVHEDPDRGGYYNWMTATAGTGPRESGNYANATASICPKGWRLPSGGSNGEFKALGDAYNQSGFKLIDVPAFSTDGYISSLAHGYSGGGLYWSYMSNGEWGAYTMMTTSSGGLYTTEGTAKDVGAHVRCILRTE